MRTSRASSRSSLIVFNRLDLPLHGSRRLAALLALPWLASLTVLFWLELSAWLIAFAVPLHLVMASWQIRLLALNTQPRSVIALHLHDSEFQLTLRNGDEVTASLKPESFVSHWFCLLRFEDKTTTRGFTVILCRWNLNRLDHLRRLRVRLRFDPELILSESPQA